MGIVRRINILISLSILVACAGAFLLFGWSGSGWKALAIPTGSMRPDIPPGSLVLVHRVPLSSLKVGDVITHTDASDSKITISHRIIKAYKLDGRIPAFVTKGDANKVADVPIAGGQVIGKVVWHVPYAGWALLDAKKPIVILPIIYIAALLIMIEEVQHLAEYYRRFIVYRVPGFRRYESENDSGKLSKRVSLGAAATTAFVLVGAAMGPTALAALRSNTVTLANNRISVAAQQHECRYHVYYHHRHRYVYKECDDHHHGEGSGYQCDGDHDADDNNCGMQCTSYSSNNVTVQTTTTQSSTTGSVTGNGNAKSGSATNTSNSSTTVTSTNSDHC